MRRFLLILQIAFAARVFVFPDYVFGQSKLSHDSLMAFNDHALSFIYSNPDTARLLANKAYELSLQQADSIAVARALTVVASVNWAEAKYNVALKLYFEALSKYENQADTTGIIICYNNIGEVYKKLKNRVSAKMYLHKAEKLQSTFSVKKYPVLNYMNIAEIHLDEKAYDSAAYYLEMAKNAPDDMQTMNYLSTINYDYSLLNKDTGNFELAKTFVDQSISFAKSTDNSRRLAESYNLLGEILFETNRLNESKVYFEQAMELALKLHHELLELKVNKNLYKLDLEEGKTINAITHILRYTELNDKIYTISVSRQAAEFETVYELDRIEKENALLQLSQNATRSVIRYQIGFLILALLALAIAIYFILAINKQRRILKEALKLLEDKSQVVEKQKEELEKQAQNTDALNKELTLLNKNLESRAQEIAREIEDKNKKMNKYAFMNAHKLRAPIASILGLINLFGKEITEDDKKAMVRMLKESAQKLDNVVHEIKDVIDE